MNCVDVFLAGNQSIPREIKMDNERTRDVLQKLINAFPKPLNIYDLGVSHSEPESSQQNFRNFLMELKQRGLIEAGFIIGRTMEDYGLPRAVGDISITNEGRKFMARKNEQPLSQQVINIGTASGNLNISGRDINITNNADAEKIIQHLLEVIEKSNLPAEKKKSLTDSVKSMIAAVTPNVLAGLFVEAAKAALPI